jgi:hypothetical protein
MFILFYVSSNEKVFMFSLYDLYAGCRGLRFRLRVYVSRVRVLGF